jgi:hypothetical protein
MSEATELREARTATSPPRHSAALIVAATLAFVGAALTVGALFPDYWDAPPLALIDQTGPLAQTAVFAGALLVAGALMLGARSAAIGAAMLGVVVAVSLQPRVVDVVRVSESSGPKAGTGFALVTAGFVLALASALLGAVVELRPRAWGLDGGARALAALGALAAFGAAVGYGMNPFVRGVGRLSVTYGSPLAPVPRELWAALLVVVVVTVVAPVAVAVGGRLGTGLMLGLLFAVGGIAAFRLGTVFGTVAGHDTGVSGAEGTWAFVAAGGAALILGFAGLAAGGGRRRRARPRPAVPAPVAAPAQPARPDAATSAAPEPAVPEPAPVDAPSGATGEPAETEEPVPMAEQETEPGTSTPVGPMASATPGAPEPPPSAPETTRDAPGVPEE